MADIAFSFSAAPLAASSCLQNLCDLLIIRGAHKIFFLCRLIGGFFYVRQSSAKYLFFQVARSISANYHKS
jgi:hypothetical protein